MKVMVSFSIHWFTPHYTNNHRPKLLHPAGLTTLISLFILLQVVINLLKVTTVPGGLVLGFASSISPSQVIELTNAERAKEGLPPLTVDERLNQAATAKANHMFQQDYWAHVAPDGTSPWTFIKNAGYGYTVAGENLARDFGETAAMVSAWMNSPTHKANIVHTKYTQIGVAVVNGKLQGVETTLVVQMFGSPVRAASTSLPPAASSDQPAPAPRAVVDNAPKPVAVADPEPALALNQLQEASPIEMAQPTLGSYESAPVQAVKTVSPLTVTKVAASSLIILLVLVLMYDGISMTKQNLPRRVGNNWAHLAFLGIVLVIIMAMTEGSIM